MAHLLDVSEVQLEDWLTYRQGWIEGLADHLPILSPALW
jgi:hypothetical protein